MSFDFVEIEDNFVPDYAIDPYRRKHIRVRIGVKEGQSLDDAEKAAEQYIKEYIYKNTVPSHDCIETRFVNPPPLPEIYVEKKSVLSYIGQIKASKTIAELKEFKTITDMNPKLTAIYNETLKQLQP